MSKYAVSLADALVFQREQPVIYGAWFSRTLSSETATVEPGRFDGEALLFRDELTGDATCRLLRVHFDKNQLRLWRNDGHGWKRL